MCENCGCNGHHEHAHEHDYKHSHTQDSNHKPGHDYEHKHERKQAAGQQTKTIVLESKVLSLNDEIAAQNRKWLQDKGVITLNLISSPGAGKTFLLEKTLEYFKDKISCAVIAGDQQTDNDAQRLRGKGHKVVQIETVSSCHLDAQRVAEVMRDVVDKSTKLLFIENVGNLVCPSAFDLGENFKIALLSVTEGEDKPVKYPALFSKADTVVLTKTDLLPHLDYNIETCRQYLKKIQPALRLFELSAQTGQGLNDWFDYLQKNTLTWK